MGSIRRIAIGDKLSIGYRRLRLDTIAGKIDAAVRLSMGFVVIPPCYPSPMPDTAYLELVL